MEVTTELRAAIVANVAIAAAAGTRVYPGSLPQTWLPSTGVAVTYQVISAVTANGLRGASGHETWRVQYDVSAATELEAARVARLLQTLLESIQQRSVGGVWVDGIAVAGGMRTSTVPPAGGSDEWLYVWSFDVKVSFQL